LQPNEDDNIEIHNERLTLHKPTYNASGDYICKAIPEQENGKESATIKVRAKPYIEDFGVQTSHTGKSVTVYDGERLELNCHVPDESAAVNITWLRSDSTEDERNMVPLPEVDARDTLLQSNQPQQQGFVGAQKAGGNFNGLLDISASSYEKTYSQPSIISVVKVDNFTKKLIIDQVGTEHRGYYTCLVDNGVTERSRKTVFVRVKDNIIALWPFLGILAELFILFTIIHIWETHKVYRESQQQTSTKSATKSSQQSSQPGRVVGTNKRAPSGPTNAFESVPLNS